MSRSGYEKISSVARCYHPFGEQEIGVGAPVTVVLLTEAIAIADSGLVCEEGCCAMYHDMVCAVVFEMPLHFVTHWGPLTCCWWGCFGSIRSKRVSLLWSWPSATLPITWCACQMESHGKKSCPQLLVLSLLDVITCHLALKGKSVKPFSMTIIFPWNY